MNNRRITLVRPSQMWDTFMDEFFNTGTGLSTIMSNIEIDMYETDNDVVVEAKVPGYKEEDISVRVEDYILTIEGTASEENEEKKNRKYHIKEMSQQSFSRSISLPTKVNAEKAEASFENGMIKVTLPKMEEVKPKTITIKPSKK